MLISLHVIRDCFICAPQSLPILLPTKPWSWHNSIRNDIGSFTNYLGCYKGLHNLVYPLAHLVVKEVGGDDSNSQSDKHVQISLIFLRHRILLLIVPFFKTTAATSAIITYLARGCFIPTLPNPFLSLVQR